jgi:hypothetical protein
MIDLQDVVPVEQSGGGRMLPYQALEIIARERREALLADAKNARLRRWFRANRAARDKASQRTHHQ